MEIKNKTKGICIMCMVSIIIICVLILFQYILNSSVSEYKMEEDVEVSDKLIYQIEKKVIGKKYTRIEGWAYIKGKNIEYIDDSVILKDCSDGKYYKINTEFKRRLDVTQMVNDGYNYDNSGFSTRIYNKKLNKNTKYRICLLYKTVKEKILCETSEFISLYT